MSEQAAALPPRAEGAGAGKDASDAREAARKSRSFVGHAKLIGFFTLISRVLGMARESVAANYFGAGVVSSAFTVAFAIPNLFRKLFGEGALSAAFIPLYAQALKNERAEEKRAAEKWAVGSGQWAVKDGAENGTPAALSSPPTSSSSDFAAASVNMLCVMLLAITAAGELVLWAMIRLGGDLRPDRLLALKFTAIMLPYVLLICGTAFLSSILQVHKRFGAPAAAPIVLNVCHIVVIVLGARFLGLQKGAAGSEDGARTAALQTTLAYWLSGFVLVAGVMQVLILAPSLRAVGFRFRWVRHFWTPAVRRMLKLSVPVALGAGVLQLSVLMDKGISLLLARGPDASGRIVDRFTLLGHSFRYPMEQGAAARLNWAQFLYQFPLGVFAIALATALFPSLSADALDKDRDKFRGALRGGIEATMFEGLAASVGLIAVRYPAIKLLFQHGHVTPHDTELIARSVLYYSTAIWAFSLLQIVNRAYYALHDTKTPLAMSVVNIVINLVVELPLVWVEGLGEAGMAVGTCVSFAVQAVLMLWVLDRRIGGLGLAKIVPNVLKMALAAGVMGAACWGVTKLPHYPTGDGKAAWVGQLTALMLTGALVYVGLCAAMGIGILEHVLPKRKKSDSPRKP